MLPRRRSISAKLEARSDVLGLCDDAGRVRKRRLRILTDDEVAFDVEAFASPTLDAE